MVSLAALEFRDVVKDYGSLRVLSGLTLSVRRGEVYGLLGPSGSGKTTAIRILMGLERRAGGEMAALGERAPSRQILSRIGYMPQETALYADLTVRENLDLLGALYGLDRARIRQRTDELLKLVDIERRADAVVGGLSGGEKRRASLVAALLHEPELLILDEPTVGIDPELRVAFWDHFRQLARGGITTLVTTHYLDEARNCDRIGLLREGRLIAEGTVPELLARAQTDDLERAFVRLAGRQVGA